MTLWIWKDLTVFKIVSYNTGDKRDITDNMSSTELPCVQFESILLGAV